jgi:alpha-tubulin suppressor-like RCC1 family protein
MRCRQLLSLVAVVAMIALAPTATAAAASSVGAAAAVGPVKGSSVVYTFGVAGTKGKVLRTEHEKPTAIEGIEGSVLQIATSNSDTYALTSMGTVWAWGIGSNGELGNGSKTFYASRAVQVDFPQGVRIASLPNPMPFDGGLAIDSRGDAWAWGLNAVHDLCLPDGLVVLHPTQIPLSDVTLGTGARTHSLFDSHGTVYACGDGSYGELGNGSAANSPTPTAVVGLPEGGVKALTSSWGGSGALMSDGSYYDWGYNRAGQLGNGTTTDSSVPVHVALRAPVTQVFQGGSGPKNGQTLAILADDSLWTWGNGAHGQLGDGTTHNATIPIRVTLPKGKKPATVASGGFATYAIDTSGKLWAWGRNEAGQLGTGRSGPDQLTPRAVGLKLRQISSTAQNVAGLAG